MRSSAKLSAKYIRVPDIQYFKENSTGLKTTVLGLNVV
jgi:hypothetical protein